MKLYFAQRGTGDVGPAITRADNVRLPREQTLRGRDYFSLFGKFAVARSCYRTLGSRDLPAGCTGQPPRAMLLVLRAGVDDGVRGRAPLQGQCRLVRAAL